MWIKVLDVIFFNIMMNLELNNIIKSFNKNSENEVIALNNVSLDFYSGEWTYIIGGNGSGKSTLLKIIAGELKKDGGNIIFNGCSNKDLIFVDQTTSKNLIQPMSIYENLIFGLKNEGMVPNLSFYMRKKAKEKIKKILSEFGLGLENRLNEQIRFLSGGEQQIIVATRILLSEPKILLMDEFTSALDQKWAPFILNKIKKYSIENNQIVIAITHDFSQIENIGDRLIMLKDGKISVDRREKTHHFTTQFILNLFYEK